MRPGLTLYKLQQEIKRQDPEELDRMLAGFFCSLDRNVESFLKKNALLYERKGFGRSYLYITDEPIPRIAAFFSVAITSTDFEKVSKTRKKKILSFDKPGVSAKDHFGGLLIGQLGRADGFGSADINGQEMIEAAEEIIESGRFFVGGRIIYLDCSKDLIPFYQKNGYELVIDEPFSNAYYKMFKALPDIPELSCT